jgi:hypothetical protein
LKSQNRIIFCRKELANETLVPNVGMIEKRCNPVHHGKTETKKLRHVHHDELTTGQHQEKVFRREIVRKKMETAKEEEPFLAAGDQVEVSHWGVRTATNVHLVIPVRHGSAKRLICGSLQAVSKGVVSGLRHQGI